MAGCLLDDRGMYFDNAGFEQLTDAIIDCAMEVHTAAGPGLLESVYGKCLTSELRFQRFEVETERALSFSYRDATFENAFRLDLVVEGLIVLEIKSVKALEPVHEAQVITYLKLTGCPIGLLFNFNVARLKKGGMRRLVHPDLYRRRDTLPKDVKKP